MPDDVKLTDAQIKHMVDRFLCWDLPEDFNPDGGISFEPEYNKEVMAREGKPPMRHEPCGTNLFDAIQAKAMVLHMLEGLPTALPSLPSDIDGLVEENEKASAEMLETARLLREHSNGDCNSIQQAIFWEEKAAALRARQAPEPFGDGYCTDCGNRTVMTDGRCSCGSGRVIADRQAPEGVVDDIKAAMSAAIWNDFLYDIDKMVYGEGSRLPDQNDAAKLAEIAYRAALSAMPSGAVKEDRQQKCENCDGTGAADYAGFAMDKCTYCDGSGVGRVS